MRVGEEWLHDPHSNHKIVDIWKGKGSTVWYEVVWSNTPNFLGVFCDSMWLLKQAWLNHFFSLWLPWSLSYLIFIVITCASFFQMFFFWAQQKLFILGIWSSNLIRRYQGPILKVLRGHEMTYNLDWPRAMNISNISIIYKWMDEYHNLFKLK